jgi:hypothetical protein
MGTIQRNRDLFKIFNFINSVVCRTICSPHICFLRWSTRAPFVQSAPPRQIDGSFSGCPVIHVMSHFLDIGGPLPAPARECQSLYCPGERKEYYMLLIINV